MIGSNEDGDANIDIGEDVTRLSPPFTMLSEEDAQGIGIQPSSLSNDIDRE